MIRDMLKTAVRNPRWFRWSHTIEDYYPVYPKPRWSPGTIAHCQMRQSLSRFCAEYETFLEMLESNAASLHMVRHEPDPKDVSAPYWNNTWFTALDAASLITLLASRKPKRFMEIGSGHSTRFAAHTIRALDLQTNLTSIDPMPRQEIDALCDRVIRKPLEQCDLDEFGELVAGDILFFDGSHRAFTNSDVVVFLFEVLPRLQRGVIVHMHDIFLPNDYPAVWNARFYNEQYLLAAMLMCGEPPFRVLAPVFFLCQDEVFGNRVRAVFRSPDGGVEIPFFYPAGPKHPGGSFWFEIDPAISQ